MPARSITFRRHVQLSVMATLDNGLVETQNGRLFPQVVIGLHVG